MMALDPLANEPRWVAWRNETRGGKPTKVPYAPGGGRGKADDPTTWGTRTEAGAKAADIVKEPGGGIGNELGDLGGDTHLAGIDLDSCLSDEGELAAWAEPLLVAVRSYTEVSPSGRGLKLFFYIATEYVRPFLELTGIANPAKWGFKRAIGEDARDHRPAVEIYFDHPFFAGDRWMNLPDEVMLLDWPILERLAQLIPPAGDARVASTAAHPGHELTVLQMERPARWRALPCHHMRNRSVPASACAHA